MTLKVRMHILRLNMAIRSMHTISKYMILFIMYIQENACLRNMYTLSIYMPT